MAFMDEVFRRQFWTLLLKNWIVLSKHPYVSTKSIMIATYIFIHGLLLTEAKSLKMFRHASGIWHLPRGGPALSY